MIKRAIERFRYLVVLFSTTSPSFPYILLLITAIVVVLIGMIAYFFGLFSVQSIRASGIQADLDAGFFDSLWWSVKHVLDPGAFSENYGAPITITIFALFNTLMGLVITGALIGFIVNFIQSRMEEMKGGIRQISEVNHTLLLGWNRKGISILKILAEMRPRQTIVILSLTDTSVVSQQLDKAKSLFRGMRILPQIGSPSMITDLNRVGIQDCNSIIILAGGGGETDGVSSDIETVKTLMLLENIEWTKSKPKVVVEVAEQENTRIIEIAAGQRTPLVSTSEFVSKTMVQCARHQGYAEAYQEIFAFENKKALNFIRPKGLQGQFFGEIAMRYDSATAIGVSWIETDTGTRKAILNPEPNYDLDEDEDIILLGNSDFDFTDELVSAPVMQIDGVLNDPINSKLKSILIIGANNNLPQILEELAAHAKTEVKVDILIAPNQTTPNQMSSLNILNVTTHSVEPSMEKCLNSTNLDHYDVVFILADENSTDPDAQTILTLLLLREIENKPKQTAFPRVVAEFVDESSKELCVDTPITDGVVSTSFVSMQLAHMAEIPVLYSIYKELLSAGGIEICFRPIDRYGLNQSSYSFSELKSLVQSTHEIAIGIKKTNKKIEINPRNKSKYEYSSDDKVVVLAQQIYGQ